MKHASLTFQRTLLRAVIAASIAIFATAAKATDLPEKLRDTGLFARGAATGLVPTINANVPSFTPQYPLWSDGAAKRRWLYLPPGTQIDATDPDAWQFPPGTKLWKEFSHDAAVETRYIERRADGTWQYATYVWNEDGTEAVLAPPRGIRALPVKGAPNGRYEVPVLGIGALQLSPDRDLNAAHGVRPKPGDVDLRILVERGLVKNLPPALLIRAPRIAAASPVERAALGYLHGNCGHCHNDNGSPAPIGLILAQTVMDSEASTNRVLRSSIDASSRFRPQGLQGDAHIIKPARADKSVLGIRMRSRLAAVQMPPLGTSSVDNEGSALIGNWISQLNHHKEQ